MSEYKLLSAVPSSEMILAGSEGDPQFFEHARFVWSEMWKAAPEVSAEPCGWMIDSNPPGRAGFPFATSNQTIVDIADAEHHTVRPLVYADAHLPAPQPAAPDVAQSNDLWSNPVLPDDPAIEKLWLSASDADGIPYHGPSFEAGYRRAAGNSDVAQKLAEAARRLLAYGFTQDVGGADAFISTCDAEEDLSAALAAYEQEVGK